MSIQSLRHVVAVVLLAGSVASLAAARPNAARRAAAAKPARAGVFVLHRPTKRDSIVTVAWALIGRPYELGGASLQRGFDCSGLVRFVLEKVEMKLPRTARQQALVGSPIERDRLLPGDLLTFGEGEHVGIYVGDGKFVHASSIAGRVVVSRIDRKPSRLIRPLSGARRLLAVADSLDVRRGGG